MKKNNLQVVIKGIRFENPVLLASGTAGDGSEISRLIDLDQLGGIITKTITWDPIIGNPPPRIWEVPGGLINSIGLQNGGVHNFHEDSAPFLTKIKTRVLISVGGRTLDEFARIIGFLEKKGAGYISAWELNLSCPNVKKGGLLFSREDKNVIRILQEVKAVTDRPIFIKLSVQSDYLKTAEAALRNGADGFSMINTLPAMAIDIDKCQACLGGVVGGLSGPAIKPVALAAVYHLWRQFQVPIIGGGGIFNAHDALEFIMVGASLVTVGTASFVDPSASIKVVSGLKEYLKNRKLEHLSQIKGQLRN